MESFISMEQSLFSWLFITPDVGAFDHENGKKFFRSFFPLLNATECLMFAATGILQGAFSRGDWNDCLSLPNERPLHLLQGDIDGYDTHFDSALQLYGEHERLSTFLFNVYESNDRLQFDFRDVMPATNGALSPPILYSWIRRSSKMGIDDGFEHIPSGSLVRTLTSLIQCIVSKHGFLRMNPLKRKRDGTSTLLSHKPPSLSMISEDEDGQFFLDVLKDLDLILSSELYYRVHFESDWEFLSEFPSLLEVPIGEWMSKSKKIFIDGDTTPSFFRGGSWDLWTLYFSFVTFIDRIMDPGSYLSFFLTDDELSPWLPVMERRLVAYTPSSEIWDSFRKEWYHRHCAYYFELESKIEQDLSETSFYSTKTFLDGESMNMNPPLFHSVPVTAAEIFRSEIKGSRGIISPSFSQFILNQQEYLFNVSTLIEGVCPNLSNLIFGLKQKRYPIYRGISEDQFANSFFRLMFEAPHCSLMGKNVSSLFPELARQFFSASLYNFLFDFILDRRTSVQVLDFRSVLDVRDIKTFRFQEDYSLMKTILAENFEWEFLNECYMLLSLEEYQKVKDLASRCFLAKLGSPL